MLAARPLDDQLADPVLLLLRDPQLALVGAAGAGGRGLGGARPHDQGGDRGAGLRRRSARAPPCGRGSRPRPCAARRRRRAPARPWPPGPPAGRGPSCSESSSVVCRDISAVTVFIWRGHLGGVLRGQHHREPHQRRVTVGVVARREPTDRRALVDHALACGVEGRACQRRAGARPPGAWPASGRRRRAAASAAFCATASRRCAEVSAARALVSRFAAATSALLDSSRSPCALRTWLCAWRCFFLSLSSAAASGTAAVTAARASAVQAATIRNRAGFLVTLGKGRSTGEAVQYGEVNRSTVTDGPHTLRYLRVITSVGISVSRTPMIGDAADRHEGVAASRPTRRCWSSA